MLAARHVVIVTNPEIAALTDAYAVIKCLSRQPERPEVQLAVNRVTSAPLGRATFDRLSEVSRRFANLPIHFLGAVPEDPDVSHRRLGQAPMLTGAPDCETSIALNQLTEGLAAKVADARASASHVVAADVWEALDALARDGALRELLGGALTPLAEAVAEYTGRDDVAVDEIRFARACVKI